MDIKKYYRKSSFAIRSARYLVTILLLLFIISCILVFRNDITIENMQLLAKFISISDGSSDLYDDEFSINSTKDSEVLMMRDNLAIIGNNNISLYYLSGQKLFSFDYGYASPAVASNHHNILVYDVGGEELSIFNSFSKIISKKISTGIRCADIATDHFAVVSSEESYKSSIIVYEYTLSEHNYKEHFKYLSSSSYITSIALSDDGKYVVDAHTLSKDGSFLSGVSIFDVDRKSDKPIYDVAIEDELPLKVGFSKHEDKIFVITDSSISFYDSKLNILSSYNYNQSKVKNYYDDDDILILTEANNLSGNSMTLHAYSKDGNEMFTVICDDQISDIAFGENKIYALGSNNIYEISKSDGVNYQISGKIALNSKFNSIVVDTKDNCYIIDNISTRKIIFK